MASKIDYLRLYVPQSTQLIGTVFTGPEGERFVRPAEYRGIGESKAHCKGDGHNIWLDLNPAGWNNTTSLGLEKTHADALALLREIASKFDVEEYDQGKINRIDIATDFVSGDERTMRKFIDAASRKVLQSGRRPILYSTGIVYKTADRKFRLYDKGAELLNKYRKEKKKGEMQAHQLKQLKMQADWCTANGVLRAESQYNGVYIKNKNWHGLTECKHGEIETQHKKDIEQFMERKITINEDTVKKLPMSIRVSFFEWLHGYDWSEGLGRSAYYEHRRKVLSVLGVDMRDDPPAQMPQEKEVLVLREVDPAEVPRLNPLSIVR